MMQKLTIFAATFVLLFATATAIDTSTVIPDLDIIGKKSKETQPRCEEKLQKLQLDCCQFYLRDSTRIPVSAPAAPVPVPPSSFMGVDQASSWREAFPLCCEQLERAKRQCICEAIKKVFQQVIQAGQLQEVQRQEMLQTAQILPRLCRIKKAQSCSIPLASF